MSGWIVIVLSLAAGLGLGLVYFGGLWLTVRGVATTRRPVLLFAASFIVLSLIHI